MRSTSVNLYKALLVTAIFCVTGAVVTVSMYLFFLQCHTCSPAQPAAGWPMLSVSMIAYSTLAGLLVDGIRLMTADRVSNWISGFACGSVQGSKTGTAKSAPMRAACGRPVLVCQ